MEKRSIQLNSEWAFFLEFWYGISYYGFFNDIMYLRKVSAKFLQIIFSHSALRSKECGLLVMQLQHLLPMTTVVYLIRFHVFGQVMSWELYYEELWVCWVPALCSENGSGWRWVLALFILAGDRKCRVLGIQPEPFHINWFLSPSSWQLFSSFWKRAYVGPESIIDHQLSSSALHISVASRNPQLQPPSSLRMCRWEQLQSTIIFNIFWTGIWKDKVVIELNYNKIRLQSNRFQLLSSLCGLTSVSKAMRHYESWSS